MKQKIVNQIVVYRMQLSEINEDGSLFCPNCSIHISPDDRTDKVYTILDVNMNGTELDEIVIRCNKCQSHICIGGFSRAEQRLNRRQKRRCAPVG